MDERPYNRAQYNRALIANALLDPFGIVLLALVLIAGILLGVLPLLAPVGAVIYLAAAARTYFDADAANKVLERERSKHRKEALGRAPRRIDPGALAPPIARLVSEARARETRIRDAIARAELPYAEVAAEVDGFIAAIDRTAGRAQLLYEALADTPPGNVERRLDEVRREPAKAELAEALATQLATLRRMETQLERFYDELERMLVELDTVRSQLVSLSASTESAAQAELAGEVRALRERMGAVADGMSAAYEGG
jgi:DNA repair exonuclease SbcCD ATPase subunit